jgi:hypothetical protein
MDRHGQIGRLPSRRDAGTLALRYQGEAEWHSTSCVSTKVNPGKMAQWLEVMEQDIIPFQVSIVPKYAGRLDRAGMVVQRIVPTSRSVAQ